MADRPYSPPTAPVTPSGPVLDMVDVECHSPDIDVVAPRVMSGARAGGTALKVR